MSRARSALFGLGLGVVASQAGHLLAYALRYGAGAWQLQSSGAHAYFPVLVKTGLGVVASATLVGLLLVSFARIAAGRPVPHQPAPSFLRLIAVLFTVQLTCFLLQEAAEAAVGGAPPSSPAVLLLWGTAGQLPVALVAALALRWLLMRLGPAVARLQLLFTPARRRFVYAASVPAFPLATEAVLPGEKVARGFNRRGPPY